MGGAEIRISDPVVSFRETVNQMSDHIVMSKSPNKHNRCVFACLPKVWWVGGRKGAGTSKCPCSLGLVEVQSPVSTSPLLMRGSKLQQACLLALS